MRERTTVGAERTIERELQSEAERTIEEAERELQLESTSSRVITHGCVQEGRGKLLWSEQEPNTNCGIGR